MVEFLCLVDQLVEKGYNVTLAETALLMFHNSINKVCLFSSFVDLFITGEIISSLLVKPNHTHRES